MHFIAIILNTVECTIFLVDALLRLRAHACHRVIYITGWSPGPTSCRTGCIASRCAYMYHECRSSTCTRVRHRSPRARKREHFSYIRIHYLMYIRCCRKLSECKTSHLHVIIQPAQFTTWSSQWSSWFLSPSLSSSYFLPVACGMDHSQVCQQLSSKAPPPLALCAMESLICTSC